jgi:asparagine synthase (glutamine-hydrolysing)
LQTLFAGILRRIPATLAERCYHPWQASVPERFRVTNFRDKWQKLIDLLGKTQLQDLYRSTICLWSKDEIRNLMSRELPISRYEALFGETDTLSPLSRLMRVDLNTYLPDAMLTKVDRASMAVGLEIRVPLLDHRVVEYSCTLPDSMKYRNGTGKYALKKLLARYLPVELFQRPKMGFGVPLDHWFRDEFKEMLLDYLSADRLNKEGLLNSCLIQKKIMDHLSGRANHQYQLWSLLMWEMWKERWL